MAIVIADLVEGGKEFRQLRREAQKVYELVISNQPNSGSTPCPALTDRTLEANRHTSPEAAAEAGTPTKSLADCAETDGPQIPNRFVWKGKCVELPPLPWRLLDFLWNEKTRGAECEDVGDAVWGDGKEPKSGALKSAILRANNALAGEEIPISLHQKNGHVAISIGRN